jgi:ABC-type transport system involved in cytochrome c biogenesis permease subunit
MPGAHARRVLFCLVVAVLVVAVAITLRWLRIGHGPFLSLHEVLISNVFSLGLVYGLMYWRVPTLRSGALFALPFLATLNIWALLTSPEATLLPPTYDNPWLWVHVVSGKLFLGTMLAAASGAACLIGRAAHDRSDLQTAVWRMVSIAFVFDSLMIIAGAAWARDAWGRYWSWDPLETWSLLIWLVLGVLLHQRVNAPPSLRLGAACVVAVFALAVVNFLGIPFLSVGAHKGIL